MHNLEFGENRKLFINELFDRLIQFSEENKWYQLLIKYAQQFERKKIGIHALNILEENKEKLNVKHGLLKKFKLIRENFEILPDIKEEDVTHEKIDLGADLFQYSSNEENVFDKISKLERNIKFIKESTGDFKLLEPLYLKLQVLDENHPGLRDFYDRQYSEKSIQTKLKKKSIKDIEMDLIKELALYTKKTSPMDLDGEDEEERDGLIRGGKKYLDLINEIDFKENVRDYYMAFFWMDLPEVCCYSIEKYLDMYINIPLERYLVLIYLKIEALMLMKKYHLASDICESIIFEKPMVDEEKINIMYLLGEVSLKLNRKDKAHEAFSWVIRKNPKYRLAKMRLKKIEQGQ